MSAQNRKPYYPVPWRIAWRVLSPSRAGPAPFRADALACLPGLRPRLGVDGDENIPTAGPALLVVNHYHRPGFPVWWLTIAVSAFVPAEIHWIITAEHTFPDAARAVTISPLSRWVLARVARRYGFTRMPAMPPRAGQEVERARAVRQVLDYVRHTPQSMVGLAPEGSDSEDGGLRWPPPGAGRFIHHLAEAGLEIVPVGIYEACGGLCARFGPHYRLPSDCRGSADVLDRQVAEVVMRSVAALLPPNLRGDFA